MIMVIHLSDSHENDDEEDDDDVDDYPGDNGVDDCCGDNGDDEDRSHLMMMTIYKVRLGNGDSLP